MLRTGRTKQYLSRNENFDFDVNILFYAYNSALGIVIKLLIQTSLINIAENFRI